MEKIVQCNIFFDREMAVELFFLNAVVFIHGKVTFIQTLAV